MTSGVVAINTSSFLRIVILMASETIVLIEKLLLLKIKNPFIFINLRSYHLLIVGHKSNRETFVIIPRYWRELYHS